MNRFMAGYFCLVVCSASFAQQPLPNPATMGTQTNAVQIKQTYTDAELVTAGLSEADITDYRTRLSTIEGQWWGHVSPAEFMMYSSENDDERKRFARIYLESNFPKALAEKEAMKAMYQVARDIYAGQVGADAQPFARRPALFVDINCADCRGSVQELINVSDLIVDIYITGFSPSLPEQARTLEMVTWAKSLDLKREQITLNDDNGLYQRKMGVPLDAFHLITP